MEKKNPTTNQNKPESQNQTNKQTPHKQTNKQNPTASENLIFSKVDASWISRLHRSMLYAA